MTSGRKAKANRSGPDGRGHKRQSQTSTAFAGATKKADAAAREKRAAPPVLAAQLRLMVEQATGSADAGKRFTRQLNKVRKQGISLDDVAAILLARLELAHDMLVYAESRAQKAGTLTELGRITRELMDLADAYQLAGRALPGQIVFRLDLLGVVASGVAPSDAPTIRTHADSGDVIETEG